MKEKNTEYYLGAYVGEYIISHQLPTLSTDMIKSSNVIEVTKEDSEKHDALHRIWYETPRESENYKTAWNNHVKNMRYLSKKYLPHELKMLIPKFGFSLIKDVKMLKNGISEALWDSDMCQYHIEHDKIEIYETSSGGWADYITLHLDISDEYTQKCMI